VETYDDSSERLQALLTTLFGAHPWHGAPAETDAKGVFNAFIEIVPTDAVKLELDKASGHLRVDRPQRFSSMCPSLYGFIPRTYCGPRVAERCSSRTGAGGIQGDGDPMDICVLTEKPIAHGDLFVSAKAVGGLRMIDGTQADEKIVAVLDQDLAYGAMADISDCPAGLIDRLRHYFLSYKQRPDDRSRVVRIAEVYGREEALEVIERSRADYRERFGEVHDRLLALQGLLAGRTKSG
jgi:inorganic pyrophosphatase